MKDYFCIQLRQSVKLALPLENVVEVMTLRWGDICPIPGVTSAILGVANQRGQLLWVLELADLLSELLGLAPSPTQYRASSRLTLAILRAKTDSGTGERAAPQLGCAVAALKGVVSIDAAEIKPIPGNFLPSFSSFLAGMAEVENESVAILNVSAIFAVVRIADKMNA